MFAHEGRITPLSVLAQLHCDLDRFQNPASVIVVVFQYLSNLQYFNVCAGLVTVIPILIIASPIIADTRNCLHGGASWLSGNCQRYRLVNETTCRSGNDVCGVMVLDSGILGPSIGISNTILDRGCAAFPALILLAGPLIVMSCCVGLGYSAAFFSCFIRRRRCRWGR